MQPPDPPLRDGAFLLRPWGPEDVAAVVDGFGHPSVTQWFPVEVPFTAIAASGFIETATAAWLADERATFAVVDAETGALAGGVDVDEIDWAGRSGTSGTGSRHTRAVAGWRRARSVLSCAGRSPTWA